MKFSEYRRLREREEQEQNTGTDAGALSATAIKQTTRRKFTDIMKEREPERYERMLAERKANSISEFTNRVNQHVTDINTQITDAADYINKNKDIYNLDADDNAERRHAEYEASKQQTIDLIKEANNNPYIDTKLREQAYDAFLNSLSSIQEADKANNAYSDYMKQFDNKEAFERTRAAERKQEELNSLSAEELQQRILDAENNLDAVKEQDKVSTKTMGFKALQEHMQTQNANKKQLENDIQSYKNELFSRQQSEALEKLSDETKAAFEEFYVLQNEGYNKDASGFEKVLDNLSGGSHVVVQRAYEDQAKEKAILELEKQGISKEEFESLYEYYKFARDEEENTTKVKEWNQEYDNAGVVGKIGMNAATFATASVKGVTALQETVDSLHYENPYAPLNINSANYELTNYTDTVRNATPQDINNDKLIFLYQIGMSMADMATLLPLSSVLGGASLALMGTNAGTSAAKEATLRGASKEQALMTGLAAGGAEVVFEKLSLDHFWDIARHQGKAATRNAFINILAQAGIEGTEEVTTDIANHFADELINRGLSEWYQNMDSYYKQGMSMTEAQKAATADYCKQLGNSFWGGALSGGAFGTAGVVNTSLTGKKSTMTADDYMQIAEGIDTERNSYMSQEDYDTAMGVQQLAQVLSKKENVTDFEKGLFEQESSKMENINWFNNPKEQIRQISERMPNETVARAFVADYKEGMPIDTYTRAFDMFYKAGYNELTFEQALSTSDAFEAVIGKPTLYAIHSLGMNQAAEASKTFTSTEQQELVNIMAKALGVTVQYQDIPGANGMYKDGTIYISNNTINPSMVVMSHELTHYLKAIVAEKYAAYENYVIDYFKKYHAKEYDSLYKAMSEQYGNDDVLIREEIVANAAETFLTDSEAVNRFVKQNRTIAEKIADFLDNFIAKLKELYQGYKAQGKAGKMLAEDIEVYEKARDLWYEAVNAGLENKRIQENDNPKFSLKSYTDEIGLRFSDKDGGDLFESILMGTDNVDYQSVLVDDGSESYRATMDLINESARILQDGIAAAGKLKDFNVTRDMAQAMAEHYLNKYSATFDEDTLTNNLFNIFAYIQNTEDVNYQDMIRLMQEVCKPVIATSQKIDKELMKQYKGFQKLVRSFHIRLNKAQKQEIESVYGKFESFKVANQNRYGYTDYGYYLSEVWDKLVEASENALSYSTPVNEQMLALHDYMTSLEKAAITPAGNMDNSQIAYDMALNIYTDYFRVTNEGNKKLVKDIKKQMNMKLDKYKKEVEKNYKQQVTRQREIVELEKQAEIDRLQKTMQTMLDNEFNAMDNEMAIYTSEVLNPEIAALKKKIKDIKQSNTQKIADLKAKNYQSYLNRSLAGKKTAHRNHIKKNMLDLQSRLAKPKEHKYIPQGLVRATIELCEAVNIDTGKSERLAEHLSEMSRLYARMKDDKDFALSSEYDPNTQEMIGRLQYIFQGRNITTLELEELQEVDELVSQLRFQIVNASKLIGMEKSREVYETAVKCMDEIKAAKSYNPDSRVSRGLNKYNSMMLNPKRQFRRMSGYKDDSVLNQIYEDLNNGQQKQMQVLMETARIFDPVTKGNHNQKCISALVGKEKKDWIDIGLNYKNMEPVMVPRAFRVSLAMHLQNKANLDHIIYGGLTIPEPKAYQRGDYATAYATGTTVHFIPADADTAEKRQQAYHDAVNKLKSVVAQMTPYEKAMVKCAETFFHEYTGEKINETSLQLNGYKKARVHNYFPIRTDSNFRPTEIEGLVRNASLENMGMLNTRVGARNPILLEDITKVIQRQSENVAKYYGLAIPIRNFNKIYNTTKIGYQDSTKSVIARKWGVTGQKYIEDLITDLQTKRGGEHTILDTLQGNFAQSVLSGNLSVAAQQVVAYPTAAATLGWDAVMKGIQYIPTKLDMEHIAKYTPLLWYRNQGTGTQEIGDVHKSKDLMSALASKATTALEHHNMESFAKLTGAGEKVINWEMELLQRIDTKAVGSLWKASEIYVRNTKKITPEQGEDAFYQEVAKVFNNCIDDTQANYSTMQRPDILRNPSKGWKMIFLFKTQPLQNFGIMYDAFGNLRAKAETYKKSAQLDEKGRMTAEQEYIKAKKEFGRAISSQLAAATGVFAMKFLANVITYRMDRYRNKEDEITGWKIVEELLNEVTSNMADSVLGGSEVYNFINSIFTDDKYYGVGIGVIDSFNDFTNSLLKMIEEPEWDNLKQLYFDAGVLIGVPGENMYKFVSGISKHWTDMTDGKDGYFNVGHETKLSVQYTTMMNALVEGDAEKYEKRYADTLESLRLTKDEDDAKAAITSGIKTKLREYYLESEITYEDAIMILEKLGDKEPYFTVKKWDNADNKEYNKYSELETAVNNGQGIDEEIEELIDNGVREENVNTKLMNIVKEGYIHGDISKERASQYLKQYKDDYTDEDVYWKLREWDKSGSYEDGEKYSKYDDLINAVESANFESVVKEYVEHGTDASTIKQQISEKYHPIYQEAYLKADYKTLKKIKDILNKLRVNGKRIYTPDDYVGWNKQAKKKEKEKKE